MEDPIYEPVSDDLSLPATKGDLKILSTNLENRLENIPSKADFSQMLTSVDNLIQQVQTYNTERSAESHRLERIEEWIKKAAEVVNVPIEF